MLGFLLAFLTALLQSTKDVLGKKFLQDIDEYLLAWGQRLFSLPLLFLVMLFYGGIPDIGPLFWLAFIVSPGINTICAILYYKAIKLSDLSQSVPLLAFSPMLLLITSPLILNEIPTVPGMIGIILIVLGSYLLNLKKRKTSFFAPFKALIKEKGSRYMLLVVLLWSITANFDKVGIQNSSVFFWSFALNAGILLFLLPVVIIKSPNIFQNIKKHFKTLSIYGLISSFGTLAQMTAISLIIVPYMVAIKRTSTIMSTIAGHFFFKEKNIKERLVGVVIMVLGVILITLFK
ncbi:MAG: EamA family transporter [Parcubacteria group bacterium]|nr:EamA family transporter [Parcubacteria group bacterium]